LDQTNALLNERNMQLARSLEFGEKTRAELDAARETLAARQKDLEQKSAEYAELTEAHLRLDLRANTLDAALANATSGLRDAHAQFAKVEAERGELAARVAQLTERDMSLNEQLTEAERRLADFEARRTRLLAKIAAERTRAEELENTNLDLRRLLASAGGEAATPEAELNGAALAFGPQQDMLDLREAITKIGRQVARLNAGEE
jgi:chromosome segregation ATPase